MIGASKYRGKGSGYLAHGFPVIKYRLWEGLARGGGTQSGGESERLHNGQVGFQVEDGGAGSLLLLSDMATLLIEHRVDASQHLLREGESQNKDECIKP